VGEWEQRFEIVRARLARIAETGDVSIALEPGALDEVSALAEIVRDGGGNERAAAHAVGWLYWYRYRALPEGEDAEDLANATKLLTRYFILGGSNVPKRLEKPVTKMAVLNAAASYLAAGDSADADELTRIARLCRHLVRATPEDDHEWPERLMMLSGVARELFTRTANLKNLDEAIECMISVVDVTPDDSPDLAKRLVRLAALVEERLQRTESAIDPGSALDGLRTLRAACPADHPRRPLGRVARSGIPARRGGGYHERPDGAGWPRVWWIPGGLLSLLPVHAAGHHADDLHDPRRRAVLDRVISSYTPTIRALRYARQHGRAAAEGSSLIVSMPVTPDLQGGELPYAEAEASEVRTLLPRPVVLTGADATLDNVLANLPGSAIAHFACHGASDPADPSQSRLLLNDHKRAPLTVARLASVNLEQAQLAYLSACRTAFAYNTELIDEAIHVATAFQLAGFPQVIGTGWEINDRLAPQVAAALYAALRPEPGMLETSQAATALHKAIQKARGRYPLHPYLWGAFLHAGA
jgi:hypothetical protein